MIFYAHAKFEISNTPGSLITKIEVYRSNALL